MSGKRQNGEKSGRTRSKRRVKSVYGMRSKNVHEKYIQLGGDLQVDIDNKRKELEELQKQLANERSEDRKRAIEASIKSAKENIAQISDKMKQVLGNVANKLSSGLSKLSAGVKGVATSLSAGVKGAAEKLGITDLYNKYKDAQAIRDYYSLKAQIVMDIQKLIELKTKRDKIQQQNAGVFSEYTTKYSNLLEDDRGVPRLFYS